MKNFFLRFPQGKSKALTLSYDDGVEQDIRLIELMQEFNIKGTFNINSGLCPVEGFTYEKGEIHRRMSKNQCTEVYSNPNVEVACHTTEHCFPEVVSSPIMTSQVIEDRKNLEQQFNRIIRGFAYPFGSFSSACGEILSLSGIAYGRTTVSTHNFALPTDWLRLSTTCHHKDEKLTELAKKFVEDTPQRNPYLFYLWGHSYEFEADNNWNVIEEFFKCVANKQDVWYATNIQIYDYVKAYESLVFSLDCSRVENKTAIDLWCKYGTDIVKIPSGDTVKFE